MHSSVDTHNDSKSNVTKYKNSPIFTEITHTSYTHIIGFHCMCMYRPTGNA